jgi:hypothetical protein
MEHGDHRNLHKGDGFSLHADRWYLPSAAEIPSVYGKKPRDRGVFKPALWGKKMATEITMTFLKKNTFHFQDARLGMREFLHTPFPCGYKPQDYMRDIVIFIRCEGPVDDRDQYMWGEDDFDNEWPSGEELPWKEDGLYYNLRCQIKFLQQLKLAKKPRITLAIVTQISTSPRKRAKYYHCVDIPRIELKFSGSRTASLSPLYGEWFISHRYQRRADPSEVS